MTELGTRSALPAVLLLTTMILMALPFSVGADELSGTTATSDQELSSLRGGFVTDAGLLVSFGIERSIYVNGVLDIATNFSISSIDSSGALPSSTSAISAGTGVKVIQIGPELNNISLSKLAGSDLPGYFTVIQNSLDNQLINIVTTLNASVTNTNLFRNLNLTSTISQQVIRGIH